MAHVAKRPSCTSMIILYLSISITIIAQTYMIHSHFISFIYEGLSHFLNTTLHGNFRRHKSMGVIFH